MKALVESYTKPWHLQCSEYTFTNLFVWGAENKIMIAEENDTMFFLLNFGENSRFMFAPLTRDPKGDYKAALDRACEYCREHGIPEVFKGISGPIKEAFERAGGYVIEEDRDNSDYVYTMEELRDLAGKKLHGKRNHINQFMGLYGESFEYVELTPDMLSECLALYREWLVGKEADDDPDARGECLAIKLIITLMEELGVVGAGIRVNGALKAYTIGERIDGEMAVVHIEKADAEVPGLFTVINNQFIKNELSDMKYINREEDMGIPNLRKAKLSYRPCKLLEKYIGVFPD